MPVLNKYEEQIKNGTVFTLWDIDLENGQIICDKIDFTVDEWVERGRLCKEIEAAAHKNDVAVVEALDSKKQRLGRRHQQKSYATAAEAIEYFTGGDDSLRERAHKHVAKVDKALGNWIPSRAK